MTVPSIRNSSQQVAVYDPRSVNRTLHQVADWIATMPALAPGRQPCELAGWDDNRNCWVAIRFTEILQGWIAEDKAIIASGAYKQAIAMLSPLAAPPTVELVSEQIIALIESKPFGHMVTPGFSRQVIEEIGYMDPMPSIAAVMAAFREMRLTPGENVPSLGSLIKNIATAEERFQGKYGRLLETEDRCRYRLALLPQAIEKERAGASTGEVYLWYCDARSDEGAKHEQWLEPPDMSSPPLTPRAPAIADGDTDGDLLD
jgi:hypothetical protein